MVVVPAQDLGRLQRPRPPVVLHARLPQKRRLPRAQLRHVLQRADAPRLLLKDGRQERQRREDVVHAVVGGRGRPRRGAAAHAPRWQDWRLGGRRRRRRQLGEDFTGVVYAHLAALFAPQQVVFGQLPPVAGGLGCLEQVGRAQERQDVESKLERKRP